MAITKRTRFEILRRDGFRCYYCGLRGNESTGAGLTIDHVIPTALGGTDDVENLVAACADCNSGKTSTAASADMVAAVNLQAAQYKAARALAMRSLEHELEAQGEYEKAIASLWAYYTPSYANSIPDGWASSIYDWHSRGVPLDLIEKGIRIAVDSKHVPRSGKWPYVRAVVRNTLDGAELRADQIVGQYDPIWRSGYDDGFRDGQSFEDVQVDGRDLLAALVDGRTDTYTWKRMSNGAR